MPSPMVALGMPDTSFVPGVLAVVALVLGFFWVTQFVQLMLLEDGVFPGRFDKVLWVVAFVFVFPLGPFAFRMWKAARLAERAAAPPAT